MLRQVAVSDKKPEGIFVLFRERFGRFDDVVVAFQHKKPGNSNKHDSIFGDSVFLAEGSSELFGDWPEEILLLNG